MARAPCLPPYIRAIVCNAYDASKSAVERAQWKLDQAERLLAHATAAAEQQRRRTNRRLERRYQRRQVGCRCWAQPQVHREEKQGFGLPPDEMWLGLDHPRPTEAPR